MADDLTNFIPGILFGGEGNKQCCCKGCKESDCGEAKCGCPAGKDCLNETACQKGTCKNSDTTCACCDPGYAKTSTEEDAECEYLESSCPGKCPGTSLECTTGWEACGCEATSIECTAFYGDFSGYEPGEKYTLTNSAEDNTRCFPYSDIPSTENGKGFVDGQDRKSCCNDCYTSIACPTEGGGGGCPDGGYDACTGNVSCDGCDAGEVCFTYYQGDCQCMHCVDQGDACSQDPDYCSD